LQKSTEDHGKVNLVIDHQVFMRDIELAYKEHSCMHPKMVYDQDLLRKTSVIGRVKVDGRLVWMAGSERLVSLDLLPDFFFSSNFFSPELEVSEKKILKRNRGKKGTGARVSYPTPTSNQSMDELS
jgi:hypothetical protein